MHDERPRWHPMLATKEGPPTHWELLDASHQVAGVIDLRRTEDGPRYRVEHRGTVVGWATSLRVAAERLHRIVIAENVPGGGVNGRRVI